jgi:CHAT domain-containing protein/Flp pilus assembly protein TadD
MPVKYFFTFCLFLAVSARVDAQQSAVPVWKNCYDSAQLYWGDDWKKTIPLLIRAERSAQNDLGIYDENYLTILNDLGLAYAQIRDYANSEKLLTKALNLKTEIGSLPDAELFRSVNNLAGVHAEQGHQQQAEQLYKRVISAPAEIDIDVLWTATKNLSILYESQDRLTEALKVLNDFKAKNSDDEKNNTLLTYEVNLVRGRLMRKSKRYDEATLLLAPVVTDLQHASDKKTSQLYKQGLQETGLLFFEIGFFNKAEKNLLQAFRLVKSEQPTDNVLLTELLNNLASVYERLAIYDKALVYYHESLDLSKQLQGTNSLAYTTILSNIAGIHLKQGDFQKAVNEYTQIRDNLKKIVPESSAVYLTVLNNLGTAYRRNNQSAQATSTLEEAYALLQKHKLTEDDLAATVMNNMAVLLTGHGEPEKAITYYEKAYTIKRTIYGENSVLLMDLASNMAVVYWALKKPDLAIPLFQKSMTLALRQIKYVFPNLSEDEQVQFYKKLKEDFERFNTVAFEAHRPELLVQVFNNQITIKSLLFFTQQHRRALIDAKHDSTLSVQYEQLRAKREQLGYLYQLSLKALSATAIKAAGLEKEIDQLEKSISLKTSETVAEKMKEQGAQWPDIQSKIGVDEALVEIIRFRKYDLKTFKEGNANRVTFGFTDSIYYAALIATKETITNPMPVLLRQGKNMETRFLNYYRNALVFGMRDDNSYPHYWEPIEAALNTKTKIYFSGDGVYHQLNLNTLRRPDNAYLLQRYDIHYLLNPAQFLERQKTTFVSRKAILFGDPIFDAGDTGEAKSRNSDDDTFAALPGTNVEVTRIDEILKSKAWSTSVYLKRLANEKNIKNVQSPDILHIATHGFFSTGKVKLSAEAKKDFLFHSGLVLAGANRSLKEDTREIYDDGILTAYEVMNLDLSHTDLVVLSACETGLGKIENGEGVYGLQRSFLQAGARNILISLWKVDDLVTQELMVKFYQYLFQSNSEREALKLAQLDLLKKTPDPMRWGGFILVGAD